MEYKVSSKVSLPVNTNNKHPEFIPESQPYEDSENIIEKIAIAIDKNIPVLLVGETGTGKTSLVRYLAKRTNNCFRRVNHNGATTSDDILGKILLNKRGTYWVDGVLIECMKKGYWYLADEINVASPEINFIYHSLLDDDKCVILSENQGEIIKTHPNFKFFGAMNPPTNYAGTKELNKALLSRFLVIKTDFPSPVAENKILTGRTNIAPDVAKRMIKFAVDIRSTQKKGQVEFILSTRELLFWATLYQLYGKYTTSAEMSLLNKVGEDDFEVVKDLLSLHFQTLDFPQKIKKVKIKM